MAGSGVTLYAVTAAGNKTVIGTIDWREDVYMPAQINDNVAQIMADMRAMANSVANGWIEIGDGDGTYTATYVSATSFQFTGVNVTAYYRAGMRVRVVAPSPGIIDGTITSSVFATHTTITVAWDASFGLSNEAITSVLLGIGSGGGSGGQPSYRNILGRNGGFEVWQRGAGGSAGIAIAASTTVYGPDGWCVATGANQASTAWQIGGITAGSRYAAQIQRNAGQTGVANMFMEFPLDTDEIVLARGNIVTVSLTLQAGANWSPSGGNITVSLIAGTGAPAKRTAGTYTGEVVLISSAVAITPTPRRVVATSSAVVPTNATQASLLLTWTPVGTAGAQDWFAIDDAQGENGSAATPFERRPFESSLLACRPHFYKTFPYNLAPAQNIGAVNDTLHAMQVVGAAGFQALDMQYPVAMRSAPTVTLFNPAAANNAIRNTWTNTDWTSTALSGFTGVSRLVIQGTTPAGSSVGQEAAVHATADAGI